VNEPAPEEGAHARSGAGSGRGGLVVLAVAAAVLFSVLVGLGIWQLERRAWKEALIARVELGLVAAPRPAFGPDTWPSLDLTGAEYQPVEVTGVFDHAREIHVVHTLADPKGPVGGLGYQVFTPVRTANGWWVYVNRGFVPRERKDPATRAEGQVAGETTVVGLLRAPHERSWFTPGDDIAGNAWFSRDPTLFAATAGLPVDAVAPYIIDAKVDPELPGGLPQGGETIVAFPNNHLQYALTWFGLAAVLVVVSATFVSRRLRGIRDG
jgi:surfeit locus 1 family protein